MLGHVGQKVFGCICINEKDEVLLVHGRNSKKWSFPKGHKKEQESPLVCAIRELKEETGLSPPPSYMSYRKMKAADYYIFSFEGLCQRIDLKVFDKNYEVDEARWWPLHSLPTEDSNVDVSILRTVMKSRMENQTVMKYMTSAYAHRRTESICLAIGR